MKKSYKKIISLIISSLLTLSVFAGCSSKSAAITIAVPNDTTNEARALLLLEEQGVIKLKDGAGISATVKDIEENPYNIEFKEVEAAQLPNVLKDVDYEVINSNYAISADLNPVKDSLAIEGTGSLSGGTVDAANDHRIAMAAAIAATKADGPTKIVGAECVQKSYPAFFEDLSSLGGVVRKES